MGSRTLSMKRNYWHAAVVTGNARTCLWHLLNYSMWQRGYYRIWVLLLSGLIKGYSGLYISRGATPMDARACRRSVV